MAFKDVKYMEPMFPHQQYEDRLVAFIDILGFKELVGDTATDVKKLGHLTAALKDLYDRIWLWEADESKVAKYPRIIIAKELKEQIEADLEESIRSQTNLPEVPGFSRLFKTDDDGWCYLDYVEPDEAYFHILDKEDHLKVLDQLTQKGLQHPKEEVRRKYPWLQKKVDEARSKQ